MTRRCLEDGRCQAIRTTRSTDGNARVMIRLRTSTSLWQLFRDSQLTLRSALGIRPRPSRYDRISGTG